MKHKVVLILSCLVELLVFAACAVSGKTNTPTAPTLSIANAGDFVTSVPPTPAPPGQAIFYDGLRVIMEQAELSTDYITEYGGRQESPTGRQFLWIQVTLENSDLETRDLPAAEHFSALYGDSEFKPTYGHREAYVDYTLLDGVLYPEQSLVAWLRFDVPAAAELGLLQIAYLPNSSRVTYLHYAEEDHPVFLWRLAP